MSLRLQLIARIIAICCIFIAADADVTNEITKADADISNDGTESSGCFRAAVFENDKIEFEDDHAKTIKANLEIYASVAKIAAENSAKIIVYPEYGLLEAEDDSIYPFLEEIPDPEERKGTEYNNPCLQPDAFADCNILRNLSCIARENGLYLVANYGTKETCNAGEKIGQDEECPSTGFIPLNTDVVFDPTGVFIKRYRKYNIFIEIYKQAPSLEHTYFDTPYGRFGVFTCFDIMFRQPALDLVEKYQIDTVLFPTFWLDELPILTALQAQDAWSISNQVNLLGANVFKPENSATGSGIYTGDNLISTGLNVPGSKLLLANVSIKPRKEKICEKGFDPRVIRISDGSPVESYATLNYGLKETDSLFALDKPEDNLKICSGKVCCTIDYKIRQPFEESSLNRLVIVVRDRLRDGPFKFYEQVCFLATLESAFDRNDLYKNIFSQHGLASFDRLNMKATFKTRSVFPFAGHDISSLIDRHNRIFECSKDINKLTIDCKHNYVNPVNDRRVYSFGMYGRIYEKDEMPSAEFRI